MSTWFAVSTQTTLPAAAVETLGLDQWDLGRIRLLPSRSDRILDPDCWVDAAGIDLIVFGGMII